MENKGSQILAPKPVANRQLASNRAKRFSAFNVRSNGDEKAWRWLALCLLAPVGGALLRKLLPEQPAFAEVAAVLPILLVTVWASSRARRLPQWIARPLVFWGLFQIVFAIPSILGDWRVGIAVIFTRVVPMLMAVVAYSTIRNWSDLRNASKWVASLTLLLLPVAVIVVLFGNAALPRLLQPIDRVLVVERDIRSGFPSAATVFTTQWILSWSALAVLYLSLSNLLLPEPPVWTRKQRILFHFAALASLFLIYASIRRGALLAGVVGFAAYFVLSRRNRSLRMIVVAVIVSFIALQLVDTFGYAIGNNYLSRSEQSLLLEELDPAKRVTDVFLPYFTYWMRTTPLGNYVGFAGPEVGGLGNLGFRRYLQVVEVGGAQLVAEMGILGAVVMPLVLVIMGFNVLRRSRAMISASAIRLLLIFQAVIFINYYLKELLALVNPSIGVFFFWSVPGICAALIDYELPSRRTYQEETAE